MGGSGACHSGRVGVGSGSGRRLAGVPATGRPDGDVPINLESGAWCPPAAARRRPPPARRRPPPSNVDRLRRRRRHNLGENYFRFDAFYCRQWSMYHGNF